MPLLEGKNNAKTFELMLHSIMDYQIDVQKISCPINLICGRQDLLTYVAYELKLANPKISLHWINKSGHFPMHENPDEFYSTIEKILIQTKNSH